MDDAKTIWVGNIADQVTEELLYELFLQAGPLERVKIPTDREGRKSTFGFVTFKHEASVPYTVQLFSGVKLFEKSLNVKPRNGGFHKDKQSIVQRSFSYPNEAHHSPNQRNEHMRFDEQCDTGSHHVSYDDLVRMSNMVNANYQYPEKHYGNTFASNRHEDSFKDRDNRDREREDFDRHRSDRDRNRRHDNSNNWNRRRNQDRRNNFDRNGGRRNNRFL